MKTLLIAILFGGAAPLLAQGDPPTVKNKRVQEHKDEFLDGDKITTKHVFMSIPKQLCGLDVVERGELLKKGEFDEAWFRVSLENGDKIGGEILARDRELLIVMLHVQSKGVTRHYRMTRKAGTWRSELTSK